MPAAHATHDNDPDAIPPRLVVVLGFWLLLLPGLLFAAASLIDRTAYLPLTLPADGDPNSPTTRTMLVFQLGIYAVVLLVELALLAYITTRYVRGRRKSTGYAQPRRDLRLTPED